MKKIDIVRWPGAVLSRIVEPEIEDLDLVPANDRERLIDTMRIGRRVLFEYRTENSEEPRFWFLVRVSGQRPSLDASYGGLTSVSSSLQINKSGHIVSISRNLKWDINIEPELGWAYADLLGLTFMGGKGEYSSPRQGSVPGAFIGLGPEALEGYRLLGIRTPLFLPDSEFLVWWSEVTNP